MVLGWLELLCELSSMTFVMRSWKTHHMSPGQFCRNKQNNLKIVKMFSFIFHEL